MSADSISIIFLGLSVFLLLMMVIGLAKFVYKLQDAIVVISKYLTLMMEREKCLNLQTRKDRKLIKRTLKLKLKFEKISTTRNEHTKSYVRHIFN